MMYLCIMRYIAPQMIPKTLGWNMRFYSNYTILHNLKGSGVYLRPIKIYFLPVSGAYLTSFKTYFHWYLAFIGCLHLTLIWLISWRLYHRTTPPTLTHFRSHSTSCVSEIFQEDFRTTVRFIAALMMFPLGLSKITTFGSLLPLVLKWCKSIFYL